MVEQRASTPYVVGSTPITLAIFFILFYYNYLVMEHKNNYYEDLLTKLEEMIQDLNNVNKIIKIIEEEFSLPYIPIYYENKLKEIYEKVKPIESKKSNLFSKDEILTILKENNNSIDFLLNVAQMMEEYNWINSLGEIQIIFNSNIDNKVKAIIFSILVFQKVDHEFMIGNIKLNPINNEDPLTSEFVLKNINIIENDSTENPLNKEIAIKSFFIYILNSFPNSIYFKFKDISKDIFCIVNVMLGNEKEEILTNDQNNIYKIIKLN